MRQFCKKLPHFFCTFYYSLHRFFDYLMLFFGECFKTKILPQRLQDTKKKILRINLTNVYLFAQRPVLYKTFRVN